MSTNNFGSNATDISISPITTYIDDDGVLRVKTPNISSSNFDGGIPIKYDHVTASTALPGMYVSFTGSAGLNDYYQIVSVGNEGDIFSGSLQYTTVINYINENGELDSVVTGASSVLNVRYEDWDNKYLGQTGWYLSNEGNAIFSNVAVRGRVEATEGTLENVIAESGKIKELDIGGNYYPILNIVGVETASTVPYTDSGQFIISACSVIYTFVDAEPIGYTVSKNNRKLLPGDMFNLYEINLSGSYYYQDYAGGIPQGSLQLVTGSGVLQDKKIVVLSSSGGAFDNVYRYHCKIYQETGGFGAGGDYWNFQGTSASSGSYSIGYMFLGEIDYTDYENNLISVTEGVVLYNKKNEGDEDYIDLSGRFKLGGGKLAFDGSNLSVYGSITATSGSFNGVITASAGKIGAFNIGNYYGYNQSIFTDNQNLVLREDGTIILYGGYGNPIYISGAAPDWKIWLNDTTINSPFRMDKHGYISARSASFINIRVSGSVFFPDVYNTTVASSRDLQIDSTGKVGYFSSSYEVKENIIPLLESDVLNIPEDRIGSRESLEFNYLDALNLIPVQFTWINGGEKEIGFVAEQVMSVIPMAGIDGDIKSYQSKMLVPAILAIVKDQQNTIDDLKNRVLQLESQLGG